MVTEDTTQIRLENHLTNLSTDLYSLYETSTLVDVTLACDGGNLYAHKVILSASSPFFAEIFASNPCKHPVVVLRSQNFSDMKAILEFMYRGYAAIEPKFLKSILKITKELEIKGFEKLDYMNSMNMIPNIGGVKERPIVQNTTTNSYSRDTRFKGTKRVNVNFEEAFSGSVPKKANSTNPSIRSDLEPLVAKEVNYESDLNDNAKLNLEPPAVEILKNSVVDLECKICLKTFKNRNQLCKHMPVHRGKTFRCDFCHKCFTRSSHLIRHRRVHTGERPYECRRCGKAFARQDKLKLHIKASHDCENGNHSGNGDYSREDYDVIGKAEEFCMGRNSGGGGRGGFEIGQVQDDFINLNDNFCASEDREHYTLKPRGDMTSPDIGLHDASDVFDGDNNSRKRGRGRPRKHPAKPESIRKADKIDVPKGKTVENSVEMPVQKSIQNPVTKPIQKPVVEMPVSKPVLNPQGPKRGRGRPRKSLSSETPENLDNYDLNNLPFGDLNLLTMPLRQEMIEMPNDISAVNTNSAIDDRSQDPLNINISTNTTERENILGMNNMNDTNLHDNSNANYNIKKHKSVNTSRNLEGLILIKNLNSLTDITITAQPSRSFDNDKTDNDVDTCQDDDNFSSSLESLAIRSNDSDNYDIDVKHEPLSDTDGDLVIDENHDDIDSTIDKISIVTAHSNVIGEGV